MSFLQFAPQYFEYVSKAFFDDMPSYLCRVLGVYRVETMAKKIKTKQYVVLMENLFYDRTITRIFDLKGSTRSRYLREASTPSEAQGEVLLDVNLLKVREMC